MNVASQPGVRPKWTNDKAPMPKNEVTPVAAKTFALGRAAGFYHGPRQRSAISMVYKNKMHDTSPGTPFHLSKYDTCDEGLEGADAEKGGDMGEVDVTVEDDVFRFGVTRVAG